MKLRNPFFKENFSDQPYFSMYMVAPFCKSVCEGCQNKNLLEYEIKEFGLQELIKEYSSNNYYQGITIAGLEIFDSGKEFINNLLEFIETLKIDKITIYTRYELSDLCLINLIDKIKNFDFVKEFYVKTGSYNKKEKSKTLYFENNVGNIFKIKLASSNQNFIRVV